MVNFFNWFFHNANSLSHHTHYQQILCATQQIYIFYKKNMMHFYFIKNYNFCYRYGREGGRLTPKTPFPLATLLKAYIG